MKRLIKPSIVLALILVVALPIVALAGNITSYTSGFQVQNLSSTATTDITITFYKQDGSVEATTTDTIAASSSKTYYPLAAVSDGFNGSVVISSNQPVAAITNVLGNDGAHGASYIGFSGGATTVNLPLVMKNNYGIGTWFNVQNTGSSDATVNIAYAGTACTDTATIKPSAAHTFDQSANTCLADGYVGAAQVTSGQNIVVTVMQVTSDSSGLMPSLLAYNGFTTSSTTPVMPLVTSGYYDSGTGIQIQNTGAASTDVTVTYTPSAGFPGATCTEQHTIAAGNSATFGFPSMDASCYTDGGGAGSAAFVGSAQVTTNSTSQNLVAIVNQVTMGASTAAAYGAFSPADATDTVSLPLIMDRNYGMFTGIAVANVGTVATDINCTFSGTTYTASATGVLPGASLTDVQDKKIADGYVGSAVCTSSNGQPIAAVVNELNTGTVLAAEDGLLVFEGINY